VRGRLLEPLSMRRTNLSVDEMLADDDHAAAYTRRDGVIVPVPQRPLPAMAPAGAINSSAADMAQWLLVQLAGGQLDGAAVMSPATAKRQLTPHMLMPGSEEMPGLTGHAYGLGWAIGRYREHNIAMPGSPPLDLEPIGGLRFGVKDRPAVTAEFELTTTARSPASSRSLWGSSSRREQASGGDPPITTTSMEHPCCSNDV
jgi:CubicO group peptidase (beta-lactamase class C family)